MHRVEFSDAVATGHAPLAQRAEGILAALGGSDMVILAMGAIGGTGSVAVTVTPPFAGSTLDRYYVQAASSGSPSFIPLAVSPSVVLRNNDVVGGAIALAGVAAAWFWPRQAAGV